MHVRYRDHVISTWFVEVIVSFVLARKKTGNLHTPVFYIYVSFCLMLSIVKAERVVSQRVVRLSRLEWRCIDVVQCVIVQEVITSKEQRVSVVMIMVCPKMLKAH